MTKNAAHGRNVVGSPAAPPQEPAAVPTPSKIQESLSPHTVAGVAESSAVADETQRASLPDSERTDAGPHIESGHQVSSFPALYNDDQVSLLGESLSAPHSPPLSYADAARCGIQAAAQSAAGASASTHELEVPTPNPWATVGPKGKILREDNCKI
jgi:hypothetical protein